LTFWLAVFIYRRFLGGLRATKLGGRFSFSALTVSTLMARRQKSSAPTAGLFLPRLQ
jgi:hypothetical protein